MPNRFSEATLFFDKQRQLPILIRGERNLRVPQYPSHLIFQFIGRISRGRLSKGGLRQQDTD